jgi:hypothetical protein
LELIFIFICAICFHVLDIMHYAHHLCSDFWNYILFLSCAPSVFRFRKLYTVRTIYVQILEIKCLFLSCAPSVFRFWNVVLLDDVDPRLRNLLSGHIHRQHTWCTNLSSCLAYLAQPEELLAIGICDFDVWHNILKGLWKPKTYF